MNQELPNIFEYATKELSQDAFLCWLLSLAHKKYANEETQALHELAVNLLNNLVNNPDFNFSEVIVKKQKEKIDIWVEIDDKYLIIIEDKTNSKAGIDQLPRYKNIAADYCKRNNFETLKCIYLKTGLESATKFTTNAKNEGWTMFSLEELFTIFNIYIENISHPFVLDFYAKAKKKIHKRENYTSFITRTNAQNDDVCVFYTHLEADGIVKSWRAEDMRGIRRVFADNYYSKDGEYAVYLQLDKMKLRVKIAVSEIGPVRGEQYKELKENLRQFDLRKIFDKTRSLLKTDLFFKEKWVKKPVFSRHPYLTFAEIEDSAWLVFKNNDTLDYEKTAENLKEIHQELKRFNALYKGSVIEIVEDVFLKQLV